MRSPLLSLSFVLRAGRDNGRRFSPTLPPQTPPHLLFLPSLPPSLSVSPPSPASPPFSLASRAPCAPPKRHGTPKLCAPCVLLDALPRLAPRPRCDHAAAPIASLCLPLFPLPPHLASLLPLPPHLASLLRFLWFPLWFPLPSRAPPLRLSAAPARRASRHPAPAASRDVAFRLDPCKRRSLVDRSRARAPRPPPAADNCAGHGVRPLRPRLGRDRARDRAAPRVGARPSEGRYRLRSLRRRCARPSRCCCARPPRCRAPRDGRAGARNERPRLCARQGHPGDPGHPPASVRFIFASRRRAASIVSAAPAGRGPAAPTRLEGDRRGSAGVPRGGGRPMPI